MNRNGYRVSVAVAPKISDSQKGLLVEGIDYALLGENADAVFLMTYEWGYTYGPPMAVAPLDKVRKVVEYAVSRIPAGKLILGIPNYGYDWPLPYEKGITRARTVGNAEAAGIAAENGAVNTRSRVQAPWFTYKKSGIEHVVWFEDPRSVEAKWNLVKEYELAGAWYWNLMRIFRANWLMMGSEQTGKRTAWKNRGYRGDNERGRKKPAYAASLSGLQDNSRFPVHRQETIRWEQTTISPRHRKQGGLRAHRQEPPVCPAT